MGETWNMTYPKTKFLSSCEPVKLDVLPKFSDGLGIGEKSSFPKEEIETKGDESPVNPEGSKADSVLS